MTHIPLLSIADLCGVVLAPNNKLKDRLWPMRTEEGPESTVNGSSSSFSVGMSVRGLEWNGDVKKADGFCILGFILDGSKKNADGEMSVG